LVVVNENCGRNGLIYSVKHMIDFLKNMTVRIRQILKNMTIRKRQIFKNMTVMKRQIF
jgi:hypothetical protein